MTDDVLNSSYMFDEADLNSEKLGPFYAVYIQHITNEDESISLKRRAILNAVFSMLSSQDDYINPSILAYQQGDDVESIAQNLNAENERQAQYPKIIFMELDDNPSSLELILILRNGVKDSLASFVIWDKLNLTHQDSRYMRLLASAGLAQNVIPSYMIYPKGEGLSARFYSTIVDLMRLSEFLNIPKGEPFTEENVIIPTFNRSKQIFKFSDGLVLNLSDLSVKRGESLIDLSVEKKKLFAYLFKNRNKVVTSRNIFTNLGLGGVENSYDQRRHKGMIHTAICKLRDDIELDRKNPKIIVTVRGEGYKLCLE